MYRNRIHILTALMLGVTAAAQNCSDNTYPIRLVDALGAPIATQGTGTATTGLAGDEQVYMAFDPALPSGLYYVHVTDEIGGHDEVLSLNEPTDRYVQVINNAGVITLTLPYSTNPNVPAFGRGLNGVGDSLALFPFRYASWHPCRYKAWLGNGYGQNPDPTNPYLLRGGYDAVNSRCFVRSYVPFWVGDGTGSDVLGLVFADADRDGVQGPGEGGVGGVEVRLSDATSSWTTTTDGGGAYRFVDIVPGAYTVEVILGAGTISTGSSSRAIEVCGCADVSADFGTATESLQCNARTIGYWRNPHGKRLVEQHDLLPQFNALGIVDDAGVGVSLASIRQYCAWLAAARATNMAYMLSAQLVGMYANVAVGYVDISCRIDDAHLGQLSIRDLMSLATAELLAHPYTPAGSPHRAYQEQLKNALDDGNNNRNWLQ